MESYQEAWFKVFDTCKELGLNCGNKKYTGMEGMDIVCLFIRNLKARQKFWKQPIQTPNKQSKICLGCKRENTVTSVCLTCTRCRPVLTDKWEA
jgi:hypothetical protein